MEADALEVHKGHHVVLEVRVVPWAQEGAARRAGALVGAAYEAAEGPVWAPCVEVAWVPWELLNEGPEVVHVDLMVHVARDGHDGEVGHGVQVAQEAPAPL